ncbi:MAG: hypothetical protein COU10_01955, partial [Candidatus Harrisonbacteria bacterium CG10_big_fil_rev_8_21_14_0_10_45_28]
MGLRTSRRVSEISRVPGRPKGICHGEEKDDHRAADRPAGSVGGPADFCPAAGALGVVGEAHRPEVQPRAPEALNYETQNHLFLNMHKTTRPQSGFSFD